MSTAYCVTAIDGLALETAVCARVVAEQALQLLLLVVCMHRMLRLSTQRATPPRSSSWLASLHLLLAIGATTLAAISLAIVLFQQQRFTSALLVTSSLDTIAWSFYSCVLGFEQQQRQVPLVVLLVVVAALYDVLALYTASPVHSTTASHNQTLAQLAIARPATTTALALVATGRYWRQQTPAPASSCSPNRHHLLPSALDTASLVSRLTYTWLSPLLTLGVTRRLEITDVPELPRRDATSKAARTFHSALEFEIQTCAPSSPSLLRVMRRLYGLEIVQFALWSSLNKAIGLTNPLLIKLLLDWAASPAPSLPNGYVLAAAMATQALVASLSNTQYALAWQRFDLRVRAGVVSAIFDRTLLLSTRGRRDSSVGTITNLVTVDVGRLVSMPSSVFDLVLLPIEIVVALFLLSHEVSTASAAGVAVLLVMLPIQTLLGYYIQAITKRMLAVRDARVGRTTETLRAVRTLKLLSWLDAFALQVDRLRAREFGLLTKRKLLDAACVFFWATTPVVVQTAVFVVVIASGKDVTAANAFTAVALLDRLVFPMNYFPWIVTGLLEARVSALRIRSFLIESATFGAPLLLAPGGSGEREREQPVVEVVDCLFTWSDRRLYEDETADDSASSAPLLAPSTAFPLAPRLAFELVIDRLTLQRKSVLIVSGAVGAGKSSLLLAMLGEMHRQSGRLRLARRRASFAPQTPWLFQGTIRANIVMEDDDSAIDETLYQLVLDVCELTFDLQRMRLGDQTLVGEHGSALSGGQRVRVGLARALFQRTALYLLDDPLSGLDTTTAARVVQNVVGTTQAREALFPPFAAVVLVTHALSLVVEHVDVEEESDAVNVLLLDRGHVESLCRLQDVADASNNTSERSSSAFAVQDDAPTEESSAVAAALVASDDAATAKHEEEEEDDSSDEHRAVGSVSLRVWHAYAAAVGVPWTLVLLFAVVAMQLTRNGLDWWLSAYTNNDVHSGITPHRFATVLLAIAGANCVAVLVRSFVFALGGLRAARRAYDKLVTSVWRASLLFFATTPLGRILNRLSSDTYAIDESLPFILNICLKDAADVVGTLVILFLGNRFVLLVLVPLSVAYAKLQQCYRPAARHLRRLDAVAQSPLLSGITDALDGQRVIRALGLTNLYAKRYCEVLNTRQRASFAQATASAWFGLRLDSLGVSVTAFVALSAVVEFHITQSVQAGTLGLTLTYALPIVNKLNALLSSFVATEQQMVAMERVVEYSDLDSEETCMVGGMKDSVGETLTTIAADWPQRGEIHVTDLTVTYVSSLLGASGRNRSTRNEVTALRNVDCVIRAGEKVGVCGRTGAGKTSFLNALLRAATWRTGCITIDSVDLASVPLSELRTKVTYIPQDVVLFAGSIRSNLDPLDTQPDHTLWAALTNVGLATTIAALAHGLDALVAADDDATLSKGQSQLLCVARALLRPSKVLCVDEATASVDHATEQLVVNTIATTFADSTVVIVAHRIATIMDCDRVLLFDNGRLVESGAPRVLANDSSSHFYSLVNSSRNSSST